MYLGVLQGNLALYTVYVHYNQSVEVENSRLFVNSFAKLWPIGQRVFFSVQELYP